MKGKVPTSLDGVWPVLVGSATASILALTRRKSTSRSRRSLLPGYPSGAGRDRLRNLPRDKS